jgi:hypothetical protein
MGIRVKQRGKPTGRGSLRLAVQIRVRLSRLRSWRKIGYPTGFRKVNVVAKI